MRAEARWQLAELNSILQLTSDLKIGPSQVESNLSTRTGVLHRRVDVIRRELKRRRNLKWQTPKAWVYKPNGHDKAYMDVLRDRAAYEVYVEEGEVAPSRKALNDMLASFGLPPEPPGQEFFPLRWWPLPTRRQERAAFLLFRSLHDEERRLYRQKRLQIAELERIWNRSKSDPRKN